MHTNPTHSNETPVWIAAALFDALAELGAQNALLNDWQPATAVIGDAAARTTLVVGNVTVQIMISLHGENSNGCHAGIVEVQSTCRPSGRSDFFTSIEPLHTKEGQFLLPTTASARVGYLYYPAKGSATASIVDAFDTALANLQSELTTYVAAFATIAKKDK